ncbi:hypothetical protein LY78DRAFT_687318 [Colletotrichum sublineola]|nr:hypothetical protein LY78DRAFT_687318 [Colletotrichum sublineola]
MGIVVGYVDPSKKTYEAVFLHALLKGSTWLNVQRSFTGLKEGQNALDIYSMLTLQSS